MTMSAPYLLDTNVYALLFQAHKTKSYTNLHEKISTGPGISFHIPEIVSMEIHSVLGKYRRGTVVVPQPCLRKVVINAVPQQCTHQYLSPPRNKINAKVFRDFQKLLKDIETGRGAIKAKIIPLDATAITCAKRLLTNYADKYSFGSHDALVAGTLLAANQQGNDLTLVTSDKGLKAVCREMQIKLYDPNLNKLYNGAI